MHWAIILGGSTGLGWATAKKLGEEGFNICVIHRDRKSSLPEINQRFERLKELPIEFISYNIDALNDDKRKSFLTQFKQEIGSSKIQVLVHSIAKGNLKAMNGSAPHLQNDDFHITLEAMAFSLYDWVKLIFNNDLFAADSRVISFTSEGNQKAWKNYAAVSAAKVALEAITRNIALEFAPHGIRANCIQAGVCDTASFRMIPGSEKLKEHSLKRNPFQRLTQPEDVANVVYLMTRPEAAWINGAIIPVDGGERIN